MIVLYCSLKRHVGHSHHHSSEIKSPSEYKSPLQRVAFAAERGFVSLVFWFDIYLWSWDSTTGHHYCHYWNPPGHLVFPKNSKKITLKRTNTYRSIYPDYNVVTTISSARTCSLIHPLITYRIPAIPVICMHSTQILWKWIESVCSWSFFLFYRICFILEFIVSPHYIHIYLQLNLNQIPSSATTRRVGGRPSHQALSIENRWTIGTEAILLNVYFSINFYPFFFLFFLH